MTPNKYISAQAFIDILMGSSIQWTKICFNVYKEIKLTKCLCHRNNQELVLWKLLKAVNRGRNPWNIPLLPHHQFQTGCRLVKRFTYSAIKVFFVILWISKVRLLVHPLLATPLRDPTLSRLDAWGAHTGGQPERNGCADNTSSWWNFQLTI